LFASKISQTITEGKKKRVEKELQEEKKEEISPLPEEEAPASSEEPSVAKEDSEKSILDKS
jgi:hypothetical protein